MKYELTIKAVKVGCYITDACSTLDADCKLGERMDGSVGVIWGGNLFFGEIADRQAVEAVIRQVIADGVTRTLVVGADEPVLAAAPEFVSHRGLTLTQEMEREDTAF